VSNEDDICDNQVDSTRRCLWCHDCYVDIAARHCGYADLASQNDGLSFVDGV